MDNLSDNLRALFNAPICPHCATLYDPEQYDDVDECAYCSNCGRAYKIAVEQRPPQPGTPQDVPLSGTAQTDALAQFREEADRVSKDMMRQTAGGSYEMYERWFTEALEASIDNLDPALRPQAISIASELGYIDDPEVMAAGFGPGLCSISGIDENYCHCGRHP
ncbi:hypothetical protein PX699_16050 [Sphingobium sp. H39-3-25]|uniref:hypothetical protein n=1 Tax=Sphingobium arseniciresistens TaxID=3030834 RepID=UPI0023B94396|nr:hypothetical protein [Sphingobium arseniciresistens]